MSRGSHSADWSSFLPARLGLRRIAIPWSIPGTAKPRTSHAGFGTSTTRLSRSLPSTVRTLDARFAGSHSRACSCALVTEELTTRMDSAPQDLQNAGCFSTTTKSKMGRFLSKPARCRLPVVQRTPSPEERRAPDSKNRRVVRSPAAAWCVDSRNCQASGSARDRKLVLCIRQRRAHVFYAPDCHRHTACSDLCAFCRRGVEQPPDSQSLHLRWLVHSSPARLGLQFHGRHRPDPHGASLPLWSLQVSAGTHLDRWCLAPTRDPGNGLYRPDHALRSRRVLGTRHWGLNREPRPRHRPLGREPHAWRPDHCRRNAFAVLRAARLCNPGIADRVRRCPSAHGAETWNQ